MAQSALAETMEPGANQTRSSTEGNSTKSPKERVRLYPERVQTPGETGEKQSPSAYFAELRVRLDHNDVRMLKRIKDHYGMMPFSVLFRLMVREKYMELHDDDPEPQLGLDPDDIRIGRGAGPGRRGTER